MKLGINVFVRDKDYRLVNKHTFWSTDEDFLRAVVDSFETAMSLYCKDYKVIHTPLIYKFEEEEKYHERKK